MGTIKEPRIARWFENELAAYSQPAHFKPAFLQIRRYLGMETSYWEQP
jgi:hypothetical protein